MSFSCILVVDMVHARFILEYDVHAKGVEKLSEDRSSSARRDMISQAFA